MSKYGTEYGNGKPIDSGAFISSPVCRNEGASSNVCEAPQALPCVRSKRTALQNLERGTVAVLGLRGGGPFLGHFASAAVMGGSRCTAGDGYEGSLKVPIEESESKRRSDEPN